MYVEYINDTEPFDYSRRWPDKPCPNGHFMGISVGWYGTKYQCLDCPDKAPGVPMGPSDFQEQP